MVDGTRHRRARDGTRHDERREDDDLRVAAAVCGGAQWWNGARVSVEGCRGGLG